MKFADYVASRKRGLTPRQEEVLSFIVKYTERNSHVPSIREIGDVLGIASTNGVADHLKRLENKGFLWRPRTMDRGHGAARAYKVLRLPDTTRVKLTFVEIEE